MHCVKRIAVERRIGDTTCTTQASERAYHVVLKCPKKALPSSSTSKLVSEDAGPKESVVFKWQPNTYAMFTRWLCMWLDRSLQRSLCQLSGRTNSLCLPHPLGGPSPLANPFHCT